MTGLKCIGGEDLIESAALERFFEGGPCYFNIPGTRVSFIEITSDFFIFCFDTFFIFKS